MLNDERPEPIVPADTFVFSRKTHNTRNANRPSHKACEVMLRNAEQVIGLSRRATSKLLGVEPEAYNKWLNGTFRMSTIYILRMSHLQSLAARGVPLGLWDRINWETGEVFYKKGVEFADGRHKIASGGWEIPKEEGRDESGISAFPHKRRRQPDV